MASKDPEENRSETKTGEETNKKRSKSRRVSFAETTAIHFFLRDEECDTPPEVKASVKLSRSESDEIRELLASYDDDGDGDDEGDDGERCSFFRPVESPSSGSPFGSATSNDEDNFFGPVSADFIKPGRLSDSAVSDDNHDVTMDSTAFSMHFRSLARSDCGEFKTPTGTHMTFFERSLDQISTPASGDLMSLTASGKRVAGSAFHVNRTNHSGNSDDMSLVGENPRRYDYGQLSHELDVLLVEDGKDKGARHVSGVNKTSDSAVFIDNESDGFFGSLSNDPTKPLILPTNFSKSSIDVLSCRRMEKKPYDSNADVFVGSTVLTPKSFQLSSKHVENDRLSHTSPSNIYDGDRSSTLKRKLVNEVEDGIDEISSSLHKSKFCKEQKHSDGDSKVPHSIGGDATTRDWIDMFSSFCGMTKLLPSLTHKLDLPQIRKLIEILAHLDKRKTYELLHRDMCSQRAFDARHLSQIKRLVDTKLLLYKNLYQKAKLHLMNLEREKLLEQVRQLDSRVEESKFLISSGHGSHILGQKDVAACPIDLSGMSLGTVDVPSLREELALSERKIRNLQDYFHVYAKVKKELTSTEITVHARQFLRNRVACRSLRSEFQICQVGSVEVIDGNPNVLVDYDGIMIQRFILKSLSTSDLHVSNTLNDVKIGKMFRGMDACIAFSFVLCGETRISYTSFGSIAQQIQKSTSLLQTLLDVVQEVELAMFELSNLTYIRFLQPSAGKLELHLSFTDFKSGARVALSIDITCLQWGIYPSQVVPYEVKGTSSKKQTSFQLLIDDIKTAIGGVRYGYRRILSLCQCVSRTIQVNCMS